MERITENVGTFYGDTKYELKDGVPNVYGIHKLGAYEDAEEQGLLVKLPCKVADKVWCLTSANTKVVECKVLWIEIHSNGVLVFSLDGGLGDVVLKHLNKKWFLTRKEAEQALKQMGE